MGPVVAEDIVFTRKDRAEPDRNGLLAAVEVAGGVDLAVQNGLNEALFEEAYAEHHPIEVEEKFTIVHHGRFTSKGSS